MIKRVALSVLCVLLLAGLGVGMGIIVHNLNEPEVIPQHDDPVLKFADKDLSKYASALVYVLEPEGSTMSSSEPSGLSFANDTSLQGKVEVKPSKELEQAGYPVYGADGTILEYTQDIDVALESISRNKVGSYLTSSKVTASEEYHLYRVVTPFRTIFVMLELDGKGDITQHRFFVSAFM